MSLEQRKLDLRQEMLESRTKRRQQAAKAEMGRRGVKPKIVVGSGYVPLSVARTYTHMNVRGISK